MSMPMAFLLTAGLHPLWRGLFVLRLPPFHQFRPKNCFNCFRAQRERDYYRRVQQEIELEWNDKSRKTVNETIFNSFLVVFTVLAAGLAYAYFDSL